jgi:SNF2 family DNA or RNA helicase
LASLAELEAHSYGVFALSGGQALRELGQKLKDFSGIQQVAAPTNLLAELRTYQQQGLNWLQFLREYRFGGILADDMGLGKTIQALSHLLLEKQEGRMSLPSLIIAPTSLMSNWRREAQRFTPDLTVLILQGTERKALFEHIHNYDVVLTTYPLLPRDEEALLVHEYYYLLLDEAQIIKNPQAKAARIVRKINAQHRLCLTGTPMENHLGELWAQFDFLMPGFLGDKANFTKLYRTPIEVHGDGEQKKRLANRVKPFMLRRTKHEVATELPLKTEIIRSVPLHPKQAALYESIRLTMEQKVRDAIAQKGLSRSHITILDALLKLRQTCCDPRTLPLKEAQKITDSAKLDLLMEMLPELLDEGRKILIFSQFTRMLSIIEKTLQAQKIGYTKLTGQTKNRDGAIEEFKNGIVNVFLISLKAGGVGLNLTEADTVIIYDPWWNPAAETQAADRAYRIGQDKPVFVYKLLTENTVEEKILAMQEKKRVLANSIYKAGDEQSQVSLTAEDLALLFEPI